MKQPHVVCFPYPGHGHIVPMVQLATFLAASKGFLITFVHTPEYLQRSVQAHHQYHGGQQSPLVRFVAIPDGLTPETRSFLHARDQLFASESPTVVNAFNELMEELMASEVPVTCIISDGIISWTNHTARRFGIPRAALWTSSASSWIACGHIPLLVSRGILPYTAEGRNDIVDCLPGLPPIFRVADLPHFFRVADLLQFATRQIDLCRQADWILCNSFEEAEGTAIDAVRKEATILPIGPLLAYVCAIASREANRGETIHYSKPTAGMCPEDGRCVKWLEAQAPSSVLYISFGSMVFLSDRQVEEIAFGLEASGVPFLWVLRPDFVEGTSAKLPAGFLERTSAKGVVVSWAPQVEVLAHESVGGFLTHCGWNSVLESVYMGVPMLGWPVASEQKMNSKMMEEQWKVGWEIAREEERLVGREEVERRLRQLMESEEGKEARRRVEKLSLAAKRTAMAGSSRANLDAIADRLRLLLVASHSSKAQFANSTI